MNLLPEQSFGTPASIVRRFLAHMLDSFILITLTQLVMLLLGSTGGVVLLGKFAITIAFLTYCHASVRQATPGKYLMKLHVVNAARGRLNLRQSLERALAYSIPALPAYSAKLDENSIVTLSMWLIFIWFLPILYTSQRTGVHDMLCRTRVVHGRVGG